MRRGWICHNSLWIGNNGGRGGGAPSEPLPLVGSLSGSRLSPLHCVPGSPRGLRIAKHERPTWWVSSSRSRGNQGMKPLMVAQFFGVAPVGCYSPAPNRTPWSHACSSLPLGRGRAGEGVIPPQDWRLPSQPQPRATYSTRPCSASTQPERRSPIACRRACNSRSHASRWRGVWGRERSDRGIFEPLRKEPQIFQRGVRRARIHNAS